MTFMMLCGVVLMGVLNALKGERIDLSLPLEAVDPRQESMPITVSSPVHLNGQHGDMFKHRRHLEEIYTNSNVTNYTTLDCKGSSSALLIQSAPVVISNIIFTNCMATAVSVTGTALMGSITFINCTFINNTGVQGGAVYVSEAVHTSVGGTVPSNTVTFQGCVFINNSATKSPSMDWSTSDYDVSSSSGGGAVMIQNADVTPSNITEGCLALNSLQNSSRAQVIFERCTFSGNHASMRGGAVYALSTADFFSTVSFFGCKFTGNTADMGAAVYIGSNSELALANNCIVENNTPWRSSAQYSNYASCGAFCSPQSNNGVFRSIQNSVFTQNGGYVNGLPGGALSVSSGDQVVYLINNTFSQNVAYQGGAIYISSTSEGFVLENSVFQNNTALMDGGAIYFSNVTNLNYTSSISNCSLAKNYAASDGGAICLSLTLSVEITSCNMWDNQAGLSGGALYSSRLSQAAITNTNFLRNSAMYGGAVSGSFETTTSVLESTFSFNHATNYGGAIECSYCNAVILDRCVIKNNTCDGSGGGLGLNYLLSLNTSAIRDTIISGNIAKLNSLRGSDLADSTSEGLGGGLALVMIQGFLIQNATFEYNMATNGGGAHISRDCGSAADPSCPSAIAQIDQESTFVANAAIGGNGGALMILTPTALSIECVPPAVGFSPSLPSLLALVVNGTGFPETGCPHWSRNYADPPPGNVMSSSVAMTKLVSVSENVDRYVSNTAFSLQFAVVDLWGQVLEPGCSSSNTSSIAAEIVDPRGSTPSSSSLSASLGGSTTSTSINGVISLNDITLLSPSGLRHIGFDFTYAAISAVNSNFMDLLGPVNGSQLIVTVNTRPCVVGEVAVLGGEACFNCSSGQYSFNPLNSTCDTCPQNADCGNLTDMGVVLPNQGYWHSHPFSVQFHPCSPTIACDYIERDSEITFATLDMISLLNNYNNLAALPDSSLALTLFNLTTFYSAQCAQGYYGIKCGGCISGYGRVGTKGCFSCPSFAYNTLAFMAQYLVSIFFIFITIRTSLMKSTTPEVSEEGLMRSADLVDPVSASSSTLIRDRGAVFYLSRVPTTLKGTALDKEVEVTAAKGAAMDGLMKCESVDLEDHKDMVMMPATYQPQHLMMMGSSLTTDQHESNVMGMIHNSALPGSTSILVGEPADHERQSSNHSTGQLVNTSMSPGSPGQKHAEKAYLPDPASGGDDSGSIGSTTTHWEHDNREHGHSTAGIEHVPVGLLPIASFHTLLPSVLLSPPASTYSTNNTTTFPEAAVVAAASISVCSSSSAASTREVQAATPISSTVWQDALLSDGLVAGPQIQHGIRHLEAEQCNYGPAVDHPAHATSTTVDITDDALAGRSLILTSSASQAVAESTAESSSNSAPRVNQDSKMEAWLALSQLRPPLSSSEPKIVNDNSSSSHTAAPAATTATKARVQFLRGDSVVASPNNARLLRASQTLVDRFETLEELRSFIADHDLRAEKELAQRQQRMRPPYSIIIKILINYLQVIPTVTNSGVVFPTFLTDFFRGASDTSSGTGTAVSLDCSLPSTSSLPKNLQAVLFYVSLPGVFCILTVPIWSLLWLRRSSVNLKPNKVVPEEETNDSGSPNALGKDKEETATRGNDDDDDVQKTGSTSRKLLAQKHSSAVGWSAWSSDEVNVVNDTNHDPSVSSFVIKKQTMGGTWKSYFSLRMLITAFSVVFYFYPNVCAAILALFACDRMDLDQPPYSQFAIIRGWYMQSDSNVQCFTGKHLILLYLIGVPGIIFFAVGVPVGSAIYLTVNKAQFESASFSAKYGFLFEDYHRHWYWWETVTLLRKLFTVAVNSSPLQAFSTTLNLLVLLAVVLVALLAQVLCRPYEIPRMNQLESLSLQAISVTIFVCTMISLPNVNYEASTLNALAVLLIIFNSAFVAFFVFSLISELHNTAVAVLDKDGDGNVSATEVAEYLKERFGFFAPVLTFFGKLTAAFHRNDSHFHHQVSKASSINAAAATSAAYPRLTVSAHHQGTASMYSFGSQRLQRNHTSNGGGTNAGNWRVVVANESAKQQAIIASSTKRFVTDWDPAAIENDHDPYDCRQPHPSSSSNDGPCMSVQGRKSDGTALNISREATVS